MEKIKKTAQEFFKKTGLELTIEVKSPENNTFPVNLTIAEPQILIGERGQNLSEIQYLLKAVLRKQAEPGELFYVDLDVNDYKKQKREYLKEMAIMAADEVSLTQKEKYLPSMPPYERRIVHMALAGRSDIVTESIGQEPERKIVIKIHS